MVLLVSYVFAALSLLVYSYTQVDLSLTLTEAGIFQSIQKAFQHIGYYQRPMSTALFIVIVLMFSGLYLASIRAFRKNALTNRQLWHIIGAVAAILVLSYPAFSYDLFNYMFTAKTVLVYHKNPYTVTPLQFSGVEPWLSFMHWTHLPSAYTPLWILITIPAYLLGFGYFLGIMWNMKLIAAAFYLLTAWCIGQILSRVDEKRRQVGMAIFALNPLIIIETLVSGHNDIVMMAFAMLALCLWLARKHRLSYVFLALSVASKLITLVLYPVAVSGWNRRWALAAMLGGFAAVLTQREVLAWYWVWIVPFVALLPSYGELTIVSLGVSIGLLLRYAPFLYFGHWNDPVPLIKEWATWVPVGASIVLVCSIRLLRRKNRASSV